LGDVYVTPSGSTLHSATADNTDGTYFQLGSASFFALYNSEDARVRFAMETFALGQYERTDEALMRYRVSHNNDINLTYAIKNASYSTYFSGYRGVGSTSGVEERNSTWKLFRQKSQSEIDDLVFEVFDGGDGKTRPLLYALYLDVRTNYAPSATNIQPSGTLGSGNNLVASWTPSDPEGDNQTQYQVKLFTAQQYGSGSFNPGTSQAYFDTGVVSSSSTSRTLPTPLPGGAYRLYVWVGDFLGMGGPSFSSFSMSNQRQQLIL
jgi:hypothetical protein